MAKGRCMTIEEVECTDMKKTVKVFGTLIAIVLDEDAVSVYEAIWNHSESEYFGPWLAGSGQKVRKRDR